MKTTHITRVQDIVPVLGRMDKFSDAALRDFRRAMMASVLDMESQVAQRTPVGVGNSAQGHLRASIYSRIRGTATGIRGEVGTPAVHGLPVEEGTKPHWPPRGALADWVRLKLGVDPDDVPSVEFLIRRKIARRGTDGVHMFEEGYEASKPFIEGQFLGAFHRAAKEIG